MEPLQYLMDAIIERERFEIEVGHQPQNAFFILLEGSFFCQFTGEEHFVAEQGDLVCFPMHSSFTRHIIEPCRIHLIYFTINTGNALDITLPQGKVSFRDKARYHSNYRSFFELRSRTDEMAGCLRNHFVNDFFLQYCMESVPTANAERVLSEPVERVIEYFSNHLNGLVSLEEVSAVAGLSPNGLIRRFRVETGCSPMQYFSHLRLSKARDALVHTTLRIGDIAEMCGYDNIYYFSSAFKKQYGLPPSEVRKAAQQV